MKSPLPEPIALEKPALVRGPRPLLLNLLIVLELLTVSLQFLFFKASGIGISAKREKTIFVIFALVWLGFIYVLWRGANWARIIVIVGAAMGIFGIFSVVTQTFPNNVLTIFNTLLSIAWLIFLLSHPAKEFTKGVAVPHSTP